MLAWQMNRLWGLLWSGKFPPLREVLLDVTPAAEKPAARLVQTEAQMLAAMQVIAAQSHGLVQEVSRG